MRGRYIVKALTRFADAEQLFSTATPPDGPVRHLETDDPILEPGRVLPADGNEHSDRRSQSPETDPGRGHSANPAPLHHEFYDGDEKKGAGEDRHRRAVCVIRIVL